MSETKQDRSERNLREEAKSHLLQLLDNKVDERSLREQAKNLLQQLLDNKLDEDERYLTITLLMDIVDTL